MFCTQISMQLKGSVPEFHPDSGREVLSPAAKTEGFRDEITLSHREERKHLGISLWTGRKRGKYNRGAYAEVAKALAKVIDELLR